MIVWLCLKIKYRNQEYKVVRIYDSHHENIRISKDGSDKNSLLVLQKECEVFLEGSKKWENLKDSIEKTLVKIGKELHEPLEETFCLTSINPRLDREILYEFIALLKDEFIFSFLDKKIFLSLDLIEIKNSIFRDKIMNMKK